MPNIPVSSPLMLMFAAPVGADKPASPLMLEGEAAGFTSVFSELLLTKKPSLEQVGMSPIFSEYGNSLPLSATENSLIEPKVAALNADQLGATEQEGIEDMALFLAQFGYVVTTEQVTKAAESGEGKILDATDSASETSVINTLTAEQIALAAQQTEQQKGEQVTNLVLSTEAAQRIVTQAVSTPTTVTTQQPAGAIIEQLKNANQQPLTSPLDEPADEGFLKSNLAETAITPNTAATANATLSLVVDVSANSQQASQVQLANLQVGQTQSINNLTQSTQLTSPQGYAASALSAEILEMDQDARQWGNTLSQRIVTMITDDVQQARIQLDPPELGSLQVRLQIQNDQATIHVQVQHGHVREALESNAFRLRDALASEGIELDSFDVESEDQQQGNFQQQADSQAEGHAQGQSNAAATELLMDAETGEWLTMTEEGNQSLRPQSSMNLLDTFA